jgi:hypothetical protein
MQAGILIGVYVLTVISVQFVGFLISRLVEYQWPTLGLMTFLLLFMAAFGIAWPPAVLIAEWVIQRLGHVVEVEQSGSSARRDVAQPRPVQTSANAEARSQTALICEPIAIRTAGCLSLSNVRIVDVKRVSADLLARDMISVRCAASNYIRYSRASGKLSSGRFDRTCGRDPSSDPRAGGLRLGAGRYPYVPRRCPITLARWHGHQRKVSNSIQASPERCALILGC